MRSERIAIALLLPALCALAACHRTPANKDWERIPMTGVRRATALAAVENLRNSLNNGACQSIYDQASESFRHLESRDWLRDCEQIRKKLGSWQTFDSQQTEAFEFEILHGRQAVTDGPGMFAKGNGQAIICWRWNAGQLQMESLSLQGGSETVSLPDRSLFDKYRDPPMERPRRPYGT